MELIGRAPWRASTHVAPHEYVVKMWSEDCHELIETIRALVREHGYSRVFAGARYRYVNIEGWRYFCFQFILNRARLDETEEP